MNIRTLSLTVLLPLIFGLSVVDAQVYKTAAGLRLGYPSAVSLKYFVTEANALEVYAGGRRYFGSGWLNLSGAYQWHSPLEIEGIEGLQWYVGAGGSIYFVGNSFSSSTFFGVQGYLGLDWAPLDVVPLSFTIDWIPTLFLGDFFFRNSFGAGFGTLGVRYVLSE